MCWAESWEQRRPSEYLFSESLVKSEWKKTRPPFLVFLQLEKRSSLPSSPASDFVLKSAQFCGCIKYKDNHFKRKKTCFILNTLVVLAFPWTISKSKDCAPVCLPSSALPRARQAGSITAPAALVCQGGGRAGSQGISRWFSHGLGLRQYHGAFLLCFLVGVWQFQVLRLSV